MAAAFAAIATCLLAGAAVSTPATAAAPETYLVLAPNGQSTAKASTRVAAAGGTVVADYRQTQTS